MNQWDQTAFKLRQAEIIGMGPGQKVIIHQHIGYHWLLVTTKGQVDLVIAGQQQKLRTGAVYFYSAEERLEIVTCPDCPSEVYFFQFDSWLDNNSLEQNTSTYTENKGMPQHLFELNGEIGQASFATIVRLCASICQTFQSTVGLERFQGQILFQQLLYQIVYLQQVSKQDSKSAIERTKIYMESHYEEKLTIEQLAHMAGISSSYYIELFKSMYQKSPIEYLTWLRMESAKQLLERSANSLNQIAQEVGYQDSYYFSRQFKKVTGISPTNYSKHVRRKIVSLHYPITGQLLALQNVPYAAPLDREFSIYYKSQYQSRIAHHLRDPSIQENMSFNLDSIAHAQPDIIIAPDWFQPEIIEHLNRMAPTFIVPWWKKNWREHLLLIAQFLDKTKLAELWLEHYDYQAQAVEQQLKNVIEEDTVLAIHIMQGKIGVFGKRNVGAVLYGDLHLAQPQGIEQVGAYELVTPEQLASFNADRILVAVNDDSSSREHWHKLKNEELWKSTKAAIRNQIYAIYPDPWFEYSASGHTRVLNETLKLFS